MEAFLATVTKVFTSADDFLDLKTDSDFVKFYNDNKNFANKDARFLGAIEFSRNTPFLLENYAFPFDKNNVTYSIAGETIFILVNDREYYWMPYTNTQYPNYREDYKQITYDFIQQSAKKMATNKEFQGMLLKKLQEAIPVKTMVEGVENMQIDSMYVTQKHMQEMFGTTNWDDVKEFLSIKVTNGVASLTYSAKGNNAKPLKIANIQMRIS
jgi:hypothetical protein